ncbi:MAG: sulfurtransferase TusA family protein [Nitrospirota bacterium]
MIKGAITLDTVGLYCPMPIILTSQKLKELKGGDILEVLSDDEGIKKDMPVWCKSTGNEFIQVIEDSGIYKVYVRKITVEAKV